jgi:hypothetical protein
MARARGVVHDKGFAYVQGREAVTETDLDRAGRAFTHYPISQSRTFRRRNGYREQAVSTAVGAGDSGPI